MLDAPELPTKVKASPKYPPTMKLNHLLLAAFLFLATSTASILHAAPKKGERFFEMRTYTTHEGQLDNLHKRFRDHTNRIFKKHDIELVGYWTPTMGDAAKNTLTYILAYPSPEARDKAWAAFRKDPQWQKVYKQSHIDAGGKIVKKVDSTFLSPTDYSPIK